MAEEKKRFSLHPGGVKDPDEVVTQGDLNKVVNQRTVWLLLGALGCISMGAGGMNYISGIANKAEAADAKITKHDGLHAHDGARNDIINMQHSIEKIASVLQRLEERDKKREEWERQMIFTLEKRDD